jgi:hypothetical protein
MAFGASFLVVLEGIRFRDDLSVFCMLCDRPCVICEVVLSSNSSFAEIVKVVPLL